MCSPRRPSAWGTGCAFLANDRLRLLNCSITWQMLRAARLRSRSARLVGYSSNSSVGDGINGLPTGHQAGSRSDDRSCEGR
jgi:hypothetical protein